MKRSRGHDHDTAAYPTQSPLHRRDFRWRLHGDGEGIVQIPTARRSAEQSHVFGFPLRCLGSRFAALGLVILLQAHPRVFSARAAGEVLIKTDLIGHTMGGREKCWKFQSAGQIESLTVQAMTENAQKRVYTIALQLRAAKGGGAYTAQARVEYGKTEASWRVTRVGLLSLEKTE